MKLSASHPTDVRAWGHRGLWWLSPGGATLLVTAPTLLLAWRIPDAQFRSAWHVGKALTDATLALLLAGLITFIIGCLCAHAMPVHTPHRVQMNEVNRPLLKRASDWLFYITIAGYLAMGGMGVIRGASPTQILQIVTAGGTYAAPLKTEFAPVPGITTLTQVGIAYVIVGSLILRSGPDRRTVRRLLVVVGLGLLRAFLLNERLAALELVVPIVAVVGIGWAQTNSWRRSVAVVAPLALLPAGLVFFGLFESARSWQFYSARSGDTLAEFVINRLAGYYVTAYNNGQLMLSFDSYPNRLPYESVQAIWTAPGVYSANIYQLLTGRDHEQMYADILTQHGNPEFNNPGGLVSPFVDFGSVGGLIFLFIAGMIMGLLYKGMTRGTLSGTLIYPAMVTGLFELPRYLYWDQGRLVPSLVLLCTLAWLLHGQRGKPPPQSANSVL